MVNDLTSLFSLTAFFFILWMPVGFAVVVLAMLSVNIFRAALGTVATRKEIDAEFEEYEKLRRKK